MPKLADDLEFADGTVQTTAATGGATPKNALMLGRGGIIPAATTDDVQDFYVVVPFDMTIFGLIVSVAVKPSVNTDFQLRRSTNFGNSFSSVSGWVVTLPTAGTAKLATVTPTPIALTAGEVLGFSITSGGGSGANALIHVIGSPT